MEAWGILPNWQCSVRAVHNVDLQPKGEMGTAGGSVPTLLITDEVLTDATHRPHGSFPSSLNPSASCLN
jgi:hypothetical protein